MSADSEWEAAEVVASLTTYIVGIEETLKEPMVQAVGSLVLQVDEIYKTLAPIVGAALDHGTVNLPWEDGDNEA